MLPRFSFVLTLIISLDLTATVAAAPEQDAAESFIQELGDQAVSVLEDQSLSVTARESDLETLLAKGFDMPFLARLALGRDFKSLSADQQSDYEVLFNDYILTTYSRRFSGFHGISLEIVGADAISDDDIVVQSQLMSVNGPPVKVDWRIRERRDQLKIIDVVIEGVSMVITQRQEFQSIVQREGLDGLMSVLRARSERATASSNQGS
ncbi:MAG: ABC transporter substrate-binding protein [Pseudomonadota bacterium]